MARAAKTYRGERRENWKTHRMACHLIGEKPKDWSAFTLASKPLNKRSRARLEEMAAKSRTELFNWIAGISAKLGKRFCLSNREITACLMTEADRP